MLVQTEHKGVVVGQIPVFYFYFNKYNYRTWNITEEIDQDKYQYYYEFIELIAEVSFRRNLQNFWKYQNDDSVNNIDLLKLALYLHPEYPLETVTSDERNVGYV